MTATETARPAIETVLSTARVSDAEREALIADPGFGRIHTDHMVAIRWNVEQGWHDAKLTAYELTTIYVQSPEVIKQSGYSYSADIWSLGAC